MRKTYIALAAACSLSLACIPGTNTLHPLAGAAFDAIVGCGAPVATDALTSGVKPSGASLLGLGSCLLTGLVGAPESAQARPEAEVEELAVAGLEALEKIKVADASGTDEDIAAAHAAVATCEKLAQK